jgi:hypothetical protein
MGPVIVGGLDGNVNWIPDGKPETANDAAPEKHEVAVAVTANDPAAAEVTVTLPHEGVANGAAPLTSAEL